MSAVARNGPTIPADAKEYRYKLGHPVQMGCCDCGLQHVEVFLLDPEDPTVVINRYDRDDDATREVRRRRKIVLKVEGKRL